MTDAPQRFGSPSAGARRQRRPLPKDLFELGVPPPRQRVPAMPRPRYARVFTSGERLRPAPDTSPGYAHCSLHDLA